jgi:hypothetical protein
MQAAAYRIGLHADPDHIVALEAVQSLFPADSHSSILRSVEKKSAGRGKWHLRGGFAISAAFLDGVAWCSCGECVAKRGSTTPDFAVPKIFHLFRIYFRQHYRA